jgi:hypothetical protein
VALDAGKTGPDRDGDGLCKHGLSDPGHVFDQQVAAGKHGCGRGDDRVRSAENNGVQVRLQRRGQLERVVERRVHGGLPHEVVGCHEDLLT